MFFFERFREKSTEPQDDVDEPDTSQHHIVAVFGAGASIAAGGVGVADIFKNGFQVRFVYLRRWLRTIKAFLRDVFCVREADFESGRNLPDIILVLSLVDLAIDRGNALVSENQHAKKRVWTHSDLLEVREKLEGLIIQTVLDPYLQQFDQQRKPIDCSKASSSFVHEIFLDHLYRRDPSFSLISMNYDMFVDRAVMQHLEWLRSGGYDPAVTCPIYSVAFEQPIPYQPGVRPLHKLHGSCDWAHCCGCGRIALLYTSRFLRERKLTSEKRTLEKFVSQLQGTKLARCERCDSMLRPVIIPPTLVKNYSNNHIRHVWSHAERELTRCTEIYFIGYGLALDDLEFISMLKRHTQDVPREQIHVITPDAGAIWRYHSVFGHSIDIQLITFQEWVARHCADIVPDYCHYARSRRQALRARPPALRGEAAVVREMARPMHQPAL